jgi:hypothetical protein
VGTGVRAGLRAAVGEHNRNELPPAVGLDGDEEDMGAVEAYLIPLSSMRSAVKGSASEEEERRIKRVFRDIKEALRR